MKSAREHLEAAERWLERGLITSPEPMQLAYSAAYALAHAQIAIGILELERHEPKPTKKKPEPSPAGKHLAELLLKEIRKRDKAAKGNPKWATEFDALARTGRSPELIARCIEWAHRDDRFRYYMSAGAIARNISRLVAECGQQRMGAPTVLAQEL
jgi:hypothetical protein